MELDTLRFLLAIARTNIEDRALDAEKRSNPAAIAPGFEEDDKLRQAFARGCAQAYRDVVGTVDRLIALTDGRPF